MLKITGIKFKNESLLNEAFTHRSYLNEDPNIVQSNERLEFLGDSVLQLLTSTELFHKFPNYPEGKLTNLRSVLVRTQTIGKIAQALGFGQFLRMSKGEERGGGRDNLSLLANTFEAVIGAMYLDQGLEIVRNFLQKHLFSQISELLADKSVIDYKSTLQEIVQEKKKTAPTYKVIGEEGPDHDKTFIIAAIVNGATVATARGKSKQEAEQEAARIALGTLK